MFETVINDRLVVMERYLRGGAVLDLGCVDARSVREGTNVRLERKPDGLFRRIVQCNPDTVGIDIDEEGVQLLRRLGYQAECGNVESMSLGRQFDTIIAGEIIEHLENPGLFLRNMLRHLKPTGVLIITTPNPFYAKQNWKIWRYGKPDVHEEHMGWQDPLTLRQLLHRTGFEVVEGCWIQPKRSYFKTWKRLFRRYFAHSFLIVASPASAVNQQAA